MGTETVSMVLGVCGMVAWIPVVTLFACARDGSSNESTTKRVNSKQHIEQNTTDRQFAQG